ncbi:MAG: IS21 family transposase [Thermodesulfobacteriota bacterium]
MIDKRLVFEIHRLAREGWSKSSIASQLALYRGTVAKYLRNPTPERKKIKRPSKLDPFADEIREMLGRSPRASAAVIRQRLAAMGVSCGISIVKDYLRTIRPKQRRAFIRFETAPGEQAQIDWGHFGSMAYGNTIRRLYCFAILLCYSRLLYLEFTHSQNQQTLHRCLLNAFRFFGGVPRELVTDNMLTAVIERDGPLIRYNEAFLDFLRPLGITPRACNPRQPQEKGKVEKGVVHYIRHNFWPLRKFKDLADLQAQAIDWRDSVANIRLHATTGERPIHRLSAENLAPLPEFLPDCRETAVAKVHTDFAIRFDGNSYSTPPWAVGRQVVVKADHHTLTVYLKDKAIVTHERSWLRKQRIELACHREAAVKSMRRQWQSSEVAAFAALGEEARLYLEHLANAGLPLRKNVARLLALKDGYGLIAFNAALKRALLKNAYGAQYIENILRQDSTPVKTHPPVRLQEERLNHIRLEEPNLAEFDAFVLKNRR